MEALGCVSEQVGVLVASPPAASASVSTRGVICQEIPTCLSTAALGWSKQWRPSGATCRRNAANPLSSSGESANHRFLSGGSHNEAFSFQIATEDQEGATEGI